jgi:uncharacterized integral membrane protein (TIGR00698 family)
MPSWLHTQAPGLALAAGAGLAAHLLASRLLPAPLAIGAEIPLAMALGLTLANSGRVPQACGPGLRFAAKAVLGLGIVLLGLRLNFQTILEVGWGALGLVLAVMALVITFSVLVGRRLSIPGRVALLIGIGTTVCGNSAILAAAPVVRATEREAGFAIATITIAGTLAVVVMPLVGHLLGLDALTFGLWSGSAVPDTAQTIGTSAAYSTVGRDVATIVKLVRTVLLAPLLLGLAFTLFRSEASWGAARTSARRAFPLFLVGFLALATVRTARVLDPETLAGVDVVTRGCFVVALAALGAQTRLTNLRAFGARPFGFGIVTAGVSAVVSLALISAFGLGPLRTQVAGAVDPRPQSAWTTICPSGPPAACASSVTLARAPFDGRRVTLTGRLLATGIPGAGALAPVGTFHVGGPLHDKRAFAASTRAGAVLDPSRLLVAATSNLGAPLAGGHGTGSVLSLATDARAPLRIAADVGARRPATGAVQLYSAQSASFLNARHNPHARTAALPAVSRPLGISLNNGFGRPWIANGSGTESVLDPDGAPLDHAPSDASGGVFELGRGVLANALVGASPDASGRAVFAAATADGGLRQIHVERGTRALAPAGTLAPLPRGVDRVGMAFNWVPDRFLYITDPGRDAVLQLRLDDNFRVFRVVATRALASDALAQPVDLAPAVPEAANPSFASNTTLAGGADLYIANRASGTIARIRQDGRVRAVARLRVRGHGAVGPGELNGVATSPDARRIYVSLGDSVAVLPAFGAPR